MQQGSSFIDKEDWLSGSMRDFRARGTCFRYGLTITGAQLGW